MFKKIGLFLSIVVLSGIANAALVAKCNQFDTVAIGSPVRAYAYHNMVFSGTNSECIRVDDVTGRLSLITSATTTWPLTGLPKNTIALFSGCLLGTCSDTTISKLPMVASSLSLLRFKAPITTGSAGSYNIESSIWFNTTSSAGASLPNAGRVSVWTFRGGTVNPPGTKEVSNVTIGGQSWEVWNGTADGVPNITYVSVANVAYVPNINLKLFISDAITRGTINSSWYITLIEERIGIWATVTGTPAIDKYGLFIN